MQRGVVQVMEGRHCFAHLTIEENLLTGSYTRKSKAEVAANLEKVYTYFPRLKTRRTSQAAYTSGGEQQMCAIGRALMANPKMVLLDEPSMGLAPQIVEEVFEIVKDLNLQSDAAFLGFKPDKPVPIDDATAMLGYPWFVTSEVIHGEKRGRHAMRASKPTMIAAAVGALMMPADQARDRSQRWGKRKYALTVIGVLADSLPLNGV